MSQSSSQDWAASLTRSSQWLRDAALPLWASRGFDAKQSAFEEQLDFSAVPLRSAPRRVMVQARQIAVFSAAALSGRYPAGADLGLRAARAMISTYLGADGAPGWVFSVDHYGKVVDSKRDLYAYAFVLFALAWVMRLERRRDFEAAVRTTLELVEGPMADPVRGGYWDCLPRPDARRRQNPHMHLFEALLALYETTGQNELLYRCRRLRDFMAERFFDHATGAVIESFDNEWRIDSATGEGCVEPGHLFEWAWLLRQYQAASGENQEAMVTALLRFAMRRGLDLRKGRIVDEISDRGKVCVASSRLWPHAEALKALAEELRLGDSDMKFVIAAILGRLSAIHCAAELNGGWIDHVDADDQPISKAMPASTLYHVYFGITAVETLA